MSKINWEQKYKTLKKNFMDTIDIAFRIGFEQGYLQAQRELQDQMADLKQQMAGLMAQGTQNVQSQQNDTQSQSLLEQTLPQSTSSPGQDESNMSSSELYSKIMQLEEVLNKSEDDIYEQKAKKSMLNLQSMFNKNLSHTQKRNLVGQEKMIRDILEKWKKQKKALSEDFSAVVSTGKIKLE